MYARRVGLLLRRARSGIARRVQYRKDDPEIERRLREILATFDTDAFAALRERHPDLPPSPRMGKYLDYETWIRRHLIHAHALGLTEGPARRILDLGTGNGYFPFVCRRLGHEAIGLDLDRYAFYNDLVSLLQVDRRVHAIRRHEPLPPLGGPFDLVTAFNVKFNRNNSDAMWNAPEWEFFLRDLAAGQLARGGEIFFRLNPMRKPGGFDAKPLLALFGSLGGEVDVPFVHFPPDARLLQTRK